jgi:antitoxin HigA-1
MTATIRCDGLPAVHPGEILRDDLEALGMDASKFAAHIGVPPIALTTIIDGQRRISGRMAQRLAQALGTSAEYWLNLQQHYDQKAAGLSRRKG